MVRIEPRSSPAVEVEDTEEFFGLVRAGFAAPRKQIRNSLSVGLGSPAGTAEAILEAAGLDPKLRAENLSLPDWARLYHAATELLRRGNQGLGQD